LKKKSQAENGEESAQATGELPLKGKATGKASGKARAANMLRVLFHINQKSP